MSATPDTIEWVDAATGEVTARSAFAEVGDALRFAPGPDGEPVPVARMEVLTAGDRREIRQIGVDGAVLLTTYQRVEPS